MWLKAWDQEQKYRSWWLQSVVYFCAGNNIMFQKQKSEDGNESYQQNPPKPISYYHKLRCFSMVKFFCTLFKNSWYLSDKNSLFLWKKNLSVKLLNVCLDLVVCHLFCLRREKEYLEYFCSKMIFITCEVQKKSLRIWK